MARKIFVNLPVKDLKKSIDFFTTLGFDFNPQFTDDKATCMILSDDGYVMLLDEKFFSTFTSKNIADTATHTEAILAISADSRAEVDDLVNRAIAAGGEKLNDVQEDGPMYGWSFQDIDGHQWEVMYMDPSAFIE